MRITVAALALVRALGRGGRLIWATYGLDLATSSAQQFEDNHTLAFVLAFAAVLTVTVIVEVIRHLRNQAPARRRA